VDETVRLWDADNLSAGPLHTFNDHDLAVLSLSVAPNNQTFCSSSMDGCIRTFDIETHAIHATIQGDPGQNWHISHNPANANELASCSQDGYFVNHSFSFFIIACSKAYVWDLRSNQRSYTFDTKTGFAMCISYQPDGKALVVGSANGFVTVLDARLQQPLHSLHPHTKSVRACSFSQDGSTLCTASDDMHVMTFDTKHAERTAALTGHASWVLHAGFHPDSQHIASCGSDRKIKLWDLPTRECIHTFDVHSDQVWALDFSPDGSKLASVGDDSRLHIATVQFER
jgi:WD repeat-containing protein 61